MPKVYLHLPELSGIKPPRFTYIRRGTSGIVNKADFTPNRKLLANYTLEEICLMCYFCVVLGYSTVGDATELLDSIPYELQSLYASVVDDTLCREHSSGIIKVFNDLEYVSNIRDKGRQNFEVTYVN